MAVSFHRLATFAVISASRWRILCLILDLQHQGASSEHFLKCGLRPHKPRLDHPPPSPPHQSSGGFLSLGGWSVDLPLRASNEGLLRPRVARAQEISGPPGHSSLSLQELTLFPSLRRIPIATSAGPRRPRLRQWSGV